MRKKYAEYGKDEPKYKHVILELQEQYHTISVYSRKYAYTDQVRIDLFDTIKPKLKYFERELLSTGNAIGEFWLYYYCSHHYEHVENDLDKQYECLLKALKVYEENPDCFPVYYYINISLSIAMVQYIKSDFLQSKESFDRIFNQYPEWMKGSVFYVDNYVQLHIALGKSSEARELIFFYHKYDRKKPFEYEGRGFGPLAILGLTYLLDNEFEMGYKCIQKAQQLCVKTSFYYLEAMIRIFENSYFFLIGSYDIAEQLTSKNIKFHQYKKCGEEGDFFMGFHRLINAFVRFKFDNKLPQKKYITVYNGWQESEFAFIGKLLEKMKNSIGLKNWPK